jgi:transcriptional regulator with XRE-family HTH domain
MRFPISTALRTMREQAGLTQGQLAEKLGLHQAVISQREHHTRAITAAQFEDYARAFGLALPVFLERMAKIIRAADAG